MNQMDPNAVLFQFAALHRVCFRDFPMCTNSVFAGNLELKVRTCVSVHMALFGSKFEVVSHHFVYSLFLL